MQPENDERLSPAEKAVFGRVYPLLNDIAVELGEHVDLIVLAGITRRLAVRGHPKRELHQMLDEHYDHQRRHRRKDH